MPWTRSRLALLLVAILAPLIPAMKRGRSSSDLLDLAAIARVPQRALDKITAALSKRTGVDCHVRQHQLSKCIEGATNRVSHILQLPTVKGCDDYEWYVLHPAKLLAHCLAECPPFNSLMTKVLRPSQSEPIEELKIVVYLDEVTPGDPIRPANLKKFYAWYMSFVNLHRHSLHKVEAWFVIAVARTSVLKAIDGGVSCATRHLLKLFTDGPLALLSGFTANLSGTPTLIRGTVTNILGDEPALKAVWSNKGAAGIKTCICCVNVIKRPAEERSDVADDVFVDVSCTEWDKVVLATTQEIWAQVDVINDAYRDLAEGKITKNSFEELETASGFAVCPQGVLSDVDLRGFVGPVETTTFDWFHTWLQGGIAAVEIYNFLYEVKRKHKLGYASLQTLATADWRWPSTHDPTKLNVVFTPARESASKDSWKASASETLTVYPLIRYFAQNIVSKLGGLDEEVESLLACFRVVDYFMLAKRQQWTTLECVLAAYQKHLVAFIKAYGREHCKPKHHYGWHCIVKTFGSKILLDAFVTERKHQEVKAYATHHKASKGFERTVLGSVMLEQTRILRDASFHDGLEGPTVVDTNLAQILGVRKAIAGTKVRFSGSLLAVSAAMQGVGSPNSQPP